MEAFIKIFTTKAILQLKKTTAKSDYLFFDDFIMGNYIENILWQLLKIGRFHSESRHFGHPHSKGAGGRKTLIFRAGLIVADNIIVFQPSSDFRSFGIFNFHDHLMRLCKIDVWVAGYLQTAIF